MASNASFNKNTGAIEVAQAYGARASKKTVLVTGVTIGSLGDAVARAFAKVGASKIIITGRDENRLAAALESCTKDFPLTTFRPLKLNLRSLKDVRTAAEEILNDETISEIDIVVGCAAEKFLTKTRELSDTDLEATFVINYLAYFHLVDILLPKIKKAAQKNPKGATRIVMVSSGAAFFSPIRFSNIMLEEGKPIPEAEAPNFEQMINFGFIKERTDGYDPEIAYAQSKAATVLMAVGLNARLASDEIFSFALHPGFVETNALMTYWATLKPEQIDAFAGLGKMKTLDQGAGTVMVAALDPMLEPKHGVWLSDCQISPALTHMTDPDQAEKLWKTSEELIASQIPS